MNIFYISYDGMADQVSRSQVLPYLAGLSKKGHEITLMSFEKKNRLAVEDGAYLRAIGESCVRWIRKRYHKQPAIPATVYDIAQGVAAGAGLLIKRKIDVIHVRGYIAACIGSILKYFFNIRMVFDMRGFWADEKVDAGSWKKDGATYRFFKHLERSFIKNADEIVVLTEAAKQFILKNYPDHAEITVIPCCVDIVLFDAARFKTRPSAGRRVLLYVGNLGSFYNLDGLIDLFRSLMAMDGSFFLRIVSGYSKEIVDEKARSIGIGASDYSVGRLGYSDMPGAFAGAECSLILYNRELSGAGCCPIKFAESLASGVPVIINAGIGDCGEIVTANRVGAVLKGLAQPEYRRAFDMMERFRREPDDVRKRCRDTACDLFTLSSGIEKYADMYGRLRG